MQTLRLFRDVARQRSFSRAAAGHAITQSAASQRVGALEKRLGVTLIDRSVRPLALTEAGELFYHEISDLLDRYERLESRLGRLPRAGGGLVRVDAIYSAGVDLLRHIEKAFQQRRPDVAVSIGYKRPEEVHAAVRAQECDLGIISFPEHWKDVAVIPLRDEVMAVVCAPRHPLARRRRVRADDLGAWPMVTFEPELPVGRRIKAYLREHGVEPDVVNVFDNVDTIKAAVAGTDRIAILPKRTVLREVAARALAVVELTPQLTRPMGLIHRRRGNGAEFPPAVQAFVTFLLEHAGPDADVVDEMDARGRRLVGGKV